MPHTAVQIFSKRPRKPLHATTPRHDVQRNSNDFKSRLAHTTRRHTTQSLDLTLTYLRA